ncbi:MAG TPA: YdcF family protein [Anaerolineales bacterium]|nr:YdcF family protein [Anaerolineales bacterium]
MFFLSKLLPLFVYPTGIVCLLLLVVLWKSKRGWRRTVLWWAFAILWLASNRWVSLALASTLEMQYTPLKEYPQVEVIVLLGGATAAQQPPRPLTELNHAADRLFYATQLYKQGVGKKILVSGGSIRLFGTGETEAQGMAQLLGVMGVPAKDILLEENSINTIGNAAESWKILQAQGVTRIVLVTSAIHMPRAVKIFTEQGFDVIPAPTDYYSTYNDWQFARTASLDTHLIYLLPDSNSLDWTTRAIREYIGAVATWWHFRTRE